MKQIIASCVYGNRFIPFTYTFLYSVTKSCPDVRIIMGYNDLFLSELNLLKITFPSVEFIEIKSDSKKNLSHAARASKKIDIWHQIFDQCGEENDQFIFLDVDTIMIKNPLEVFTSGIDLIITRKKSKWPLNSGVLFVCKNPNTLKFFYNWHLLTNQLISDKQSNSMAESAYGGADQEALIRVLNISQIINRFDLSTFESSCSNFIVKIKFVDCEEYNQTESAKLTPLTKIIHFKAGWHKILIDGARYSKNRPKKNSFEFHQIWKNYYSEAKICLYNAIYKKTLEQQDLVKEISKIEYLPRGIYNSELLLVISVLKFLEIGNVLESGRARGHSTQIISKLLQDVDSHKSLISLDFKRDNDAKFAESNLAMYPKTKLVYGDANLIIKKIISKSFTPPESYAVLLDGPKSFNALYLTSKLIRNKTPPSVIFIHDMKKTEIRGKLSLQRFMCSEMFDRVFFSDEFPVDANVKACDTSIPLSKNTYNYNRETIIFLTRESYGPTLAVIFPSLFDDKILKKFFLWPIYQFSNIYKTIFKFILIGIVTRLKMIF
jgi:hypothetical protein